MSETQMIYDVAICGAGLAGLTLVRQLKQALPNLSVILFDRASRPLPKATHKVGESTVSVGTYYLANTLGLKDYLNNFHLPKLGLRYFFGNSHGSFEDRPELGQSEFFQNTYPYQLDRGQFEADLRQFNAEAGVTLQESSLIKDIQLFEDLDSPHRVIYTQADGTLSVIQARWVIDAMGRRRFLQKKLGLALANEPRYSAVWFRIKGRIDVSNFVSASHRQWHGRVPNNNRYYSTNHLCGDGYWVWLIPISSGYTSIGIVADETVHPFKTYHTYERAYAWLKKHEPTLASHLQGKQPADFKKMPRYSYSSSQVFSIDRWACVGEAGVFSDPFHSSGTDLIALENCLVTQMIEFDFTSGLMREAVEDMNGFLLTYRDRMTNRIQSYYSCFNSETVTALKYVWDIMIAWSFNSPLMINSLLFDSRKRLLLEDYYERLSVLEKNLQQFCTDWAKKTKGDVTYTYIDYTKLSFMNQHRQRNFSQKVTDEALMDSQAANLKLFEEFAIAIFLIAVADVMPEQLSKVTSTGWLNAEAISLNPEAWEIDGLFSPSTQPRSLQHVIEPLVQALKLDHRTLSAFAKLKNATTESDTFTTGDNTFSQTCFKVPALH